LDLPDAACGQSSVGSPRDNIRDFLNFLSAALPDGDVYLFGGLIRDVALLGRRGFSSDIDIVVEGDWRSCASYLETLAARKNKFGGYRVEVDGWPVDIWKASETWAIRQGLVAYTGIASLTATTVLNWDAILMNWRTKAFVCSPDYLQTLRARLLDIVLEENPNPLGMAVRVFRHFCLKDAKHITSAAAKYLAACANTYDFETIKRAELQSYGRSVIDFPVFTFFQYFGECQDLDGNDGFEIASILTKKKLGL